MLFAVVNSDDETFHFFAAASTSICLAVAPALRRRSHEWGTAPLPPVTCLSKLAGSSGACTTFTLDQSASSSSATISGNEVLMFWPSSGFGERIVMIPSGAMDK